MFACLDFIFLLLLQILFLLYCRFGLASSQFHEFALQKIHLSYVCHVKLFIVCYMLSRKYFRTFLSVGHFHSRQFLFYNHPLQDRMVRVRHMIAAFEFSIQPRLMFVKEMVHALHKGQSLDMSSILSAKATLHQNLFMSRFNLELGHAKSCLSLAVTACPQVNTTPSTDIYMVNGDASSLRSCIVPTQSNEGNIMSVSDVQPISVSISSQTFPSVIEMENGIDKKAKAIALLRRSVELLEHIRTMLVSSEPLNHSSSFDQLYDKANRV